jgi:hypothetical protein
MFGLRPPRHISTLPWPCENSSARGAARRPMMPTGSEHLPPRGAFGPTFHPDVIATNRSASVPTSTVPATWLSGSSTRSSSVVGSRRVTTNSRPTTSRSSNLRRYVYGCALMSPRPSLVRCHSKPYLIFLAGVGLLPSMACAVGNGFPAVLISQRASCGASTGCPRIDRVD